MSMTIPATCSRLRPALKRGTVGLALAILVSTAVPAAAGAQALPQFPDGAMLKVWAPDARLESDRVRFVQWQPESLSVQHRDSAAVMDLAFPSVTRVDLLDGKDTGRGALMGLGIGGAIGGLLGLVIGMGATSGCEEFLCELEAMNYMAVGFGVGGATGLAVGITNPPDRWVRQDLPSEMGFPEAGPDYSALGWVAVAMLVVAAGS